MSTKAFIKVFSRAELKAILASKGLIGLVFLILTSTLFIMGISKGFEEILRKRMESPFIQYLNVNLPQNKALDDGFIFKLDSTLKTEELKSRFSFERSSFIRYYSTNFKGTKNTIKAAKCRPVVANDDFFQFVLDQKDNHITQNVLDIREHKWSVIVTQDFLNRLGLLNDIRQPTYLNYILPISETEDLLVPIAIGGIVEKLPDDCQILCSESLMLAFEGILDPNPLNIKSLQEHSTYYKVALSTKTVSALNIINKASQETYDNEEKVVKLGLYENDLIRAIPENEIKKVFDFNSIAFTNNSFNQQRIIYDNLVVKFDNLKEVENFTEYMQTDFGLRVDMNSIESSKNFKTFQRLAQGLSQALKIIGLFFIIYIVTRLLLEHISKNAKNLGTLKAFGLTNISVSFVYALISFFLTISVFILSFISSFFMGVIVNNSDTLTRLIIGENVSLSVFMNGSIIGGFILYVVIPTFLVSMVIYRRVSTKTPGDLIYNR